MQTPEVLAPEPSSFDVESAVEKLNPDIDQIPPEVEQARDNALYSEIHKHINSFWNKERISTAVEEISYFTYL
jgi:hypothetical protein